MSNRKTFLTSIVWALAWTAVLSVPVAAQDLARYRDFQFGMTLEAVATQVRMHGAEAKTVHARPELIQTLQWDQSRTPETPAKTSSLRTARFDFFNGELSRIAVTYDPAGTNGMTAADMIEAISAIYGPATMPQRTIPVFSSTAFHINEQVLAAWEDSQYSYNLYRSSFGNVYGLVAFSRRLDLMATVSIREAVRLDELEAPEKARALRLSLDEEKRALDEKARLINKPQFNP